MVIIVICPAKTLGAVDEAFGWKVLLRVIIWRLQVQSQQQVNITREYLL